MSPLSSPPLSPLSPLSRPPARSAAQPLRHDEGELDEEYDDEFDEYDEYDDEQLDDEDAEEESPAREWLVMTAQLAIGAVGGAALWLGFQWLWQTLPLAALIAALLVITVLVWVVRRIRRSDDMQTTVVTVLVGLFVTVSPAALLLLGR